MSDFFNTKSYSCVEGIPFFLKYSSPERERKEPAEVATMNALAPKLGCMRAMEQVYGTKSGMLQYSGDPRRANFIQLLQLDETKDVLEIGIGFGQHTVEIAKKVRALCALEVCLQNALFAKQRCSEAGLENVEIACGGDDCVLPYKDNSFDVVIMNLVFEWAGSRHPSPSAGQQLLLREACRVLRGDRPEPLLAISRFDFIQHCSRLSGGFAHGSRNQQ